MNKRVRFEIRRPDGLTLAGVEGPAKSAMTEAFSYFLKYVEDGESPELWCKVGSGKWHKTEVTLCYQ